MIDRSAMRTPDKGGCYLLTWIKGFHSLLRGFRITVIFLLHLITDQSDPYCNRCYESNTRLLLQSPKLHGKPTFFLLLLLLNLPSSPLTQFCSTCSLTFKLNFTRQMQPNNDSCCCAGSMTLMLKKITPLADATWKDLNVTSLSRCNVDIVDTVGHFGESLEMN